MPESTFRFVHAADLHLDAPFAAIGRVAPAIADRLRDASLQAFDALVALAIEREAAFVVFAGDIYDSADRGVRAQLRFLRGVERLGERSIPVFVAHGNHDPLDGWSAMRRAPANLTIFSGTVEAYRVARDGEPLAHIYGVSYPARDVTENLALRFRKSDAPGLHVGVLHCNVGSQPDHAAYSPCSIADLAATGMDYWALGHIHRHLRLAEGGPWIVYPGSLQAGKASEVGPKGAVLVEAAGSHVERVDFVDLDYVRFAQVEIDISDETDLHALRKTILDRAVSDGKDLLLTVVLTGRGPLYRDLRRSGAAGHLLRDVRDELGIASPFVWVDRILDHTRAELDREAIRRRGDFSTDLTRLVDGLRADPQALRDFVSSLPAPGRVDPVSGSDIESLLREAEERAWICSKRKRWLLMITPVLLIVRSLAIGGCERDLTKIALALDRSRFEPHVACFHEGMRSEELRAAGVPILLLPVRSLYMPSALHGAILLGRYLRGRGIQLVHAFDVPTDLFAVPVASAFGVPAIVSSQLSYRTLCGPLTRRALRIIDRLSHKVLVNSKAVGRHLIEDEGLSEDEIFLCYNGVDTRAFQPREIPLEEASLVIGSVCVLRPEKQMHLLLQAFARVRKLRPGITLSIVGSGPELARLERLRDELGLAGECRFTPATSGVAPWMRSMDIFVLASANESFPNALLEAMACGCAVIGSRVGGVPEMITDGFDGSLFEPGAVDSLTARLTELVNDSARRAEYSRNAPRTAQKFSLEIAVRRMEELYSSLLNRAARRRMRGESAPPAAD